MKFLIIVILLSLVVWVVSERLAFSYEVPTRLAAGETSWFNLTVQTVSTASQAVFVLSTVSAAGLNFWRTFHRWRHGRHHRRRH